MKSPKNPFRPEAMRRYAARREHGELPRFRRTWLGRRFGRRVPVRLQLTQTECGAACLAMILSYYGRDTRVAEVRDELHVGRDGLTALTITETARHYGLRVKAYTVEHESMPHLPMPAIAHWEFNHFLVLESWSPKGVAVVDPAVGRRRLTPAQFDAGFTGVALTFEPGVGFTKVSDDTRPGWRRYLGTMLQVPEARALLVQVFLASLLLQLVGLALPQATRFVIDRLLPTGQIELLPAIALGMFLVFAIQWLIAALRGHLLVTLQGRLDSHLMLGFFEHLLSLPFSYFRQRSSGDLLMRLGSNQVIRETLTGHTTVILLDGSFVLVYLGILLWQAPLFGGVALLLALLQLALLLSSTARVRELTAEDLIAGSESQSYLVEALIGMATLKASGTEARALDHWSNLFSRHLNISLARGRLAAQIEAALSGLRTLTPLLLLWLGAHQVLAGNMTLGSMLAVNALALLFLTPLGSLVSSGRELQFIGAHLERLADVLEAEPEQSVGSGEQLAALQGNIELSTVTFGYRPEEPILHEISLTVQAGQKVALVGPTGSGKSTLAMLLLGLYSPDAGSILYDGVPLNQLDVGWLRRRCGVVLQEPFLFSGSIRQNIAFKDPALSLEEVRAAARLAAIDDEIMQMPMGYETLLNEGGIGLSGGQRQRLALARALVERPSILLLDEATSSLDTLTEAAVDHNLDALGCTRIVIAHRLSTVRNADQILVLHQGHLVEQGKHEELLAGGGQYAALVHGQADMGAGL